MDSLLQLLSYIPILQELVKIMSCRDIFIKRFLIPNIKVT